MGRSSSPPGLDGDGNENGKNNAINNNSDTNNNNNDQGFYSIRDRFPFKRNPGHSRDRIKQYSLLERPLVRNRARFNRKGLLHFPFRGIYLFYFLIFFSVFAFAVASMVMQSSITAMLFRQGGERSWRRSIREGLRFGSSLKFMPAGISRLLAEGGRLDPMRSTDRIGLRGPRLALVLGNMKKNSQSLMLVTVVKSLQRLGYVFKIYALGSGEARGMWENLSAQFSFFGPQQFGHIDWSMFEGVIADSLEAKEAISSLMQEPFDTLPLIWIVQEDTLAKRLPVYEEKGLQHLVLNWKTAFTRANVILFPDFTLPMLYSMLDTGNFHVIPESPVDVWGAESYSKTHEKQQLRKDNGFSMDDMVVLVVGSSFFYDELSWDYAVALQTIGPLLQRYTRRNDVGGSFKFIFLSGNSTDGYNDALQQVASRLGLPQGSVRHYGLDGDTNGVILMADIVLYGSSQEEQGFPPLIIRAMTFGIPVITPDFPIVKKYVVDGAHCVFFPKHDPDALLRAFSLLISNGRLSKFAETVASSGRLLAKNILASECITGYASLLVNLLYFPSDVLLPGPVSELQQASWEWNLFRKEIEHSNFDTSVDSSVVYTVEEELTKHIIDTSKNRTELQDQDALTGQDLDLVTEIENFEDYERLEMEEINERTERHLGVWDEIYRNARKSEKLRFEANERDEGELERTGQPVCIYEIYSGAGAWPFLHHGSLYRGLSLSRRARRLTSDDVDAVGRLPLLNSTYYRDLLCEVGGMFSIANRVDSIHKRPWIGFQSWQAAGRKVSLSTKAEKVLEETIQRSKGDAMYFWSHLDADGGGEGSSDALTFWSMCDILNAGHCRTAFENAFRNMYNLPLDMEALPPMPQDEGHWSSLHSWVMPTKSFLEFVMFSRMFVDSLDALQSNSSEANMCLLGSTYLEKKQCYCRVLELLVNVWVYHSGRRMVYIEPHSGLLEEQHPVEQRKEFMWARYFNFTLLKSMDEDLAEAADDADHPRKVWLWPLTGEVHWQGIYEREREERYRLKMDKKRKTKEKLLERMRNGYRQRPLGL
ncbi:hypothetical protein ES332_D05G325000v1 [Gossypium tomentosum]|uniref:Glycosyl transferase family 1 domain-containing protein n=1 Tax=Gossypium tomentosum TaxID=34277 RepID=A0A5D2L2V3_GOSTO|nr:hypothetical protein ES332_D05G325000v1 [Gossypium tomentosum]